MNKNVIIALILLIIVIAIGFFLFQSNNSSKLVGNSKTDNTLQENLNSDAMKKDADEAKIMEMKQITYMYEGVLTDVTKGEVRGINTYSQSSGIAKANFADGKYMMMATFNNLPEPVNGDFYEGWVVQKNPFKFISTGKVEKIDGVYTNLYSSGEDLTSFNRYVLTLEPNDGDPAPADHIVEGDMLKQ